MIEPRGCIELGCRFLYSYEDQLTGGRYMGCMRKVFSAEIDVDMFELAEADGTLHRVLEPEEVLERAGEPRPPFVGPQARQRRAVHVNRAG